MSNQSEDPPIRTGQYKSWEEAYIKENWKSKSDTEMAIEIGRSPDSLALKRRGMGLVREMGRPILDGKEVGDNDASSIAKEVSTGKEYSLLSISDKKQLLTQRFKATKRYKQVERSLDEEELSFYIERWTDYINTWETILSTEEDTLHLALMELIRADRILDRQRRAVEGDEQVPIDLYDRQYQQCVETYNKLMSSLAGTRQQRLASGKDSDISLVSVVQKLQDQQNRKKAGEEAAAINIAKVFTTNKFREKGFIIDGN